MWVCVSVCECVWVCESMCECVSVCMFAQCTQSLHYDYIANRNVVLVRRLSPYTNLIFVWVNCICVNRHHYKSLETNCFPHIYMGDIKTTNISNHIHVRTQHHFNPTPHTPCIMRHPYIMHGVRFYKCICECCVCACVNVFVFVFA